MRYAHSNDTINERRRIAYGVKEDAVNTRRRAARKATQQHRRDSVVAARRNRFDSAIFCELEDHIPHLQEVMAQRKQDLDAARDEMGVTTNKADP